MGCRRYFAASRLEVLLDEDDSRSSSRVREHGSFLLLSQLHVAIQTLWSQCLFPRVVWTNGMVVHSQVSPVLVWSASTFSSPVFVFIYTSHRHWHTTLYRSLRSWVCAFAKQDIFSDFLGKQTRWLLTRLPIFDNEFLSFGWIRWESLVLPAIIQFFHPITFEEVVGGGRGDIFIFSFLISWDSIKTTFWIQ